MYVRWNLPPGVSDSKYALLLLASGCPAVLLAKKVGMNPKTLSIYRCQAMSRLGMGTSPLSLYRGLRLLKQLQRTPLMQEEGNLSENVRATLTAG